MEDSNLEKIKNKICFVGGPGTGKSTLSQAVTVALKMKGLDIEQVPEYARTYIRRSGVPNHYLEQFPILIGAMRHEEEANIHDIMISDSASFIMAVYMIHYRPKEMDKEEQVRWEYHFKSMQGFARERMLWFDHIIYVPALFEQTIDDPSRWNAEDAYGVGISIKTYLEANGINYYEVESLPLEQRVEEVIKYLEKLKVINKTPKPKKDQKLLNKENIK